MDIKKFEKEIRDQIRINREMNNAFKKILDKLKNKDSDSDQNKTFQAYGDNNTPEAI